MYICINLRVSYYVFMFCMYMVGITIVRIDNRCVRTLVSTLVINVSTDIMEYRCLMVHWLYVWRYGGGMEK